MQVRAKADRRLAAMVNPALRTFEWAMGTRQRVNEPSVALRAAMDVLDRNGFTGEQPKVLPFTPPLPGQQTTITTTIRTEALTDEELAVGIAIMRKVGVKPGSVLPVIDVPKKEEKGA